MKKNNETYEFVPYTFRHGSYSDEYYVIEISETGERRNKSLNPEDYLEYMTSKNIFTLEEAKASQKVLQGDSVFILSTKALIRKTGRMAVRNKVRARRDRESYKAVKALLIKKKKTK